MRTVGITALNLMLVLSGLGIAFLPQMAKGVISFAFGLALCCSLFTSARLALSAYGAAAPWRIRTGQLLVVCALLGVMAGLLYGYGWMVMWNSMVGVAGLAFSGRVGRRRAQRGRGPVRAPVHRRDGANVD